jgi:hypothetical protein
MEFGVWYELLAGGWSDPDDGVWLLSLWIGKELMVGTASRDLLISAI